MVGRGRGVRVSYLFQVVQVNMGITEGMNKVTRFQASNLCHHLQQQGIRCDVERYSQEGIGAALVHLQTESSVGYVKLEECMTRRKIHVVQVAHVPCTDYDAS